jgi:competence CoiA-like predicted nuclease
LKIKLPYGLKDENLISIDEVESGLACDCFCPACKKQLIAKKGKVNVHHFAHYKVKDCNGGIETAITKLLQRQFYITQIQIMKSFLKWKFRLTK